MKHGRLALALVTALLGLARASFAKDATLVADFEGKQHGALHDRVVKALKKAGVSVAPGAGAAPGDADARKAASKKRGLSLFVEGSASVSNKGVWTLSLSCHGAGDAGEGELSLEAKSVAGLFKKIDAEVPKFVKEHLDEAKAPAAEPEPEAKKKEVEPEPEPELKDVDAERSEKKKKEAEEQEQSEEKPAPKSAHDGRGQGPSPLTVGLAPGAFSRHFSYNQDVNQNLRPYDLGLGFAARVWLGWYPGAHFSHGGVANLGIVADYEQSFFAKSKLDATGQEFQTTMRAFSVGLRGRIPIAAHELGLSVRYGQHSFDVAGDDDPAATSAIGTPIHRDLFPDVRYSYLEPALDLRLAFGSFGVGFLAGYRLVLSPGPISDAVWFPNAKVSSLHAGLFVSYELVPSLHALLGVDVRRYGYSMHSKPADVTAGKDVAGGAIDQYLSAYGGIEWRLGGD